MHNHSASCLHDVVIAGAGPVGLFLACELRLAGVSVLVLEQAEDAQSPLKRLPFGLRGLWGQGTQALHRRGLLDQVMAAPRGGDLPRPGDTSGASRRPAGHFAGLQFEFGNVDASRWIYRLPGPADAHVGVEMEHLEQVLSTHARCLGAEIRYGEGVEAFDAGIDGVVVHAGGQPVRARWLVGCDGGRSTVRRHGGFEFVGTEPEFTGYSAQVEIADPSMLPPGRHYTRAGMFTQWQPGFIAIADFDGGASHRNQPLTMEHLQGVLRRVSGTEATLVAMPLASTWTDRSKQCTTYRRGRVLLAGDAAHIHSPLGGQGLDLGFGDAMNLGWKLAATIRGEAPEGLLDSYTTERHPVGARVLDWTRAQVALLRPESAALRAVMRDLMDTRDGATYFADRVWGVSLRHDLGSQHPLVGRSAPDFELGNGTRLGTLLQDGVAILLDFEGGRSLQAIGAGLPGMARYLVATARDNLGLSALFIRPDGIVAWACDGKPDTRELRAALSRWLPAT